MVINNISSLELLNTSIVSLWPCTKGRAEGELEVDGRSYDVRVLIDAGYRVWASVVVSKPHILGGDPERASLLVAKKALSDDSWLLFGVDPHDGEALLSTTLTVDMSAAALDRFYKFCQQWLHDNIGEVNEVLGIDCAAGDKERDVRLVDDGGDLFSGFSMDDLDSLV